MKALASFSCFAGSGRLSNRRVRARKDDGFSLLEVLISIIILSFGLLGMVGLQAAALQSNREARLQSTAASLARELAEMMRGNKDVALATTSNPYLVSTSSPLTPTTASYCLNVAATSACADATTTANAQMTEWLTRVDAELPGARVSICADSAPFDAAGLPVWACGTAAGGLTTIKIGWTQGSTDRTLTTVDRATRPSIVFPVTPGNSV